MTNTIWLMTNEKKIPAQKQWEQLSDRAVPRLAAALMIAAVAGKQICGLEVLKRGIDRLSVGIGMIPRGEVGLMFASIGRAIKVIDDATFSAAVIMVIITTLITPLLLK